jgi:hypothetical protein
VHPTFSETPRASQVPPPTHTKILGQKTNKTGPMHRLCIPPRHCIPAG